MADEIKTELGDIQEGREMAWHNKTKVKADLSLDNCEFAKKEVHPEVLGRFIDGKFVPSLTGSVNEKGENVPFVRLVTEDGREIADPYNPETYRPLTHAKFVETLNKSMANIKGAVLQSIGTMKGRERLFASFKLPDLSKFNIGTRVFESFFSMGVGFSKQISFYAKTSNICVVCANTDGMTRGYNSPGIDIRIKLTKNSEIEIANLPQVVDGAIGLRAEYEQCLKHLAQQTAKEEETYQFYLGFLAGDKPKVLSTRLVNTAQELLKGFKHGAGNEGKNRLDVYMSGTDYYSHASSGGSDRIKQWTSSEIGTGATRKLELYEMLLSPTKDKKSGRFNWTDTGWKNAIRIGQESLVLTEKVEKATETAIANAMASLN